MSDELVVILSLACGLPALLAVVAVIAAFFTPRARAERALRKAPATPFGQLADGAAAKLVGRAQPAGGHLVEAPLGGRRVLGYELTIQYRDGANGHGPGSTSRGVDFVVRTDGGEVTVRWAEPQLVLWHQAAHEIPAVDAPAWMVDLLPIIGVHIQTKTPTGTIVLSEAVLEPGDRVAAMGVAKRTDGGWLLEPDPQRGLHLGASADEPQA